MQNKWQVKKKEQVASREELASYELPAQVVSIPFQGTWAFLFIYLLRYGKCWKQSPCQLWKGIQLFAKGQAGEAQPYP